MERFGAMDHERGLATARFWLGINELNRSFGGRVDHLESAVDSLTEIGDLRLVSVGHRLLSDAALAIRDEDEARRRGALASNAAKECADGPAIIGSLVQQSLVEALWGEPSAAAGFLLDADSHLGGSSEYDLNAVLGWPTVPVLLRLGEADLARAVLANSDRVFALHARTMPPSAQILVESYRRELEDMDDGHTVQACGTLELAELVRGALAR
jgi:hypothetical protein